VQPLTCSPTSKLPLDLSDYDESRWEFCELGSRKWSALVRELAALLSRMQAEPYGAFAVSNNIQAEALGPPGTFPSKRSSQVKLVGSTSRIPAARIARSSLLLRSTCGRLCSGTWIAQPERAFVHVRV
jgi:hypothetical protein